MPQAWEARLDPKEIAAFRTLYGDARISEKIYADLFRLMLQSKAKGTIYILLHRLYQQMDSFCQEKLLQRIPA